MLKTYMQAMCAYGFFIFCMGIVWDVHALPYYRQQRYRALDIGFPGLQCSVEGSLYRQVAKRAYDDHGDMLRNGSIAALAFSGESFLASDALANSSAATFTNPWLTISRFSPRLYHHEWNITPYIDCAYVSACRPLKVGIRFEAPYRVVKRCVQEPFNDYSCHGSGQLGNITTADVLRSMPDGTFAYRLDVLSRFPYDIAAPGNTVALVNYYDDTFNGNPLTISNQDCTDTGGNPVVVAPALCSPSSPYGMSESAAASASILPANGAVYANNKQRFGSGINYTPLGNSIANQSMLWVEPAIDESTGIPVASARIIRTHVTELIEEFGSSAEDFFTRNGFFFDSVKKHGFSDGMAELYATYQGDHWCSIEAGLRCGFPFAKKSNPYRVFDISLGTNGHYQGGVVLRTQLQQSCFVLLGCAELLHVFGARECIAIPFVGSSALGLSTMADVRVSYDWYRLALQGGFNTEHFALQPLYELSATSLPDVCAKNNEYADLFGVIHEADFSLYVHNAMQVSHIVGCMARVQNICINPINSVLQGEVGVRGVIAGHNVEIFTTWYASIALQF